MSLLVQPKVQSAPRPIFAETAGSLACETAGSLASTSIFNFAGGSSSAPCSSGGSSSIAVV